MKKLLFCLTTSIFVLTLVFILGDLNSGFIIENNPSTMEGCYNTVNLCNTNCSTTLEEKLDSFVNGMVIFSSYIPTLICFIVFLISIPKINKMQKRNKIVNYLLWLELHLYSFVLGSSFISIGMDNNALAYASIVAMLLCAIISIIEISVYKIRIVIRTTVLSVLIISFIILNASENWMELPANTGVLGFVFSIPLIIITIMYIVKNPKDEKIIPVIIKNDNIPKGHYLPINYLSIKELIIWRTIFLLLSIGLIVLVWFNRSNFLLIMLFIIIWFLLYIMFIIVKELYNARDLRRFNMDLDYEKFKTNFLSKLDNPKINPEYKNYYKSLYAASILPFHLDEYFNIMSGLFESNIEAYKVNIELNKVHVFLPKEEYYSEYERLINKYKDKNNYLKLITRFNKRIEPLHNKNYNGSIDLACPINTKNNSVNAINLYIQIFYYYYKENYSKASELKKLFLIKYSALNECVKRLSNIEID